MERLIFVTKSPTAHGDKERVSQSCFLSSREKYWVSPAAAKGKMEACVTPPRTEPVSLGEIVSLGWVDRRGFHATLVMRFCSALCKKGGVTRHLFTRWTINYPPDEGSKGGRAELTSKVDNLSWTF